MSEERKVESLADLPELEAVCNQCDGSGEVGEVGTYQTFDCSECGGAGFIPTEFGEKVLALVQHNLRIDHGKTAWR